MSVFRLCDNVPPVYPEGSRDFQLLCNLFDLVYGSTKFNIDTIRLLSDTQHCRSSLLTLLQHKLGLYMSTKLDDDSARTLLKCFPYVVRKKGSVEGITEMLSLFLSITHRGDKPTVYISNRNDLSGSSFIVEVAPVSISGNNMSLLSEMLSYVIPTGYFVEYSDKLDDDFLNTETTSSDTIKVYLVDERELSKVVSNGDSYDFIGRTGTVVIAPKSVADNNNVLQDIVEEERGE